MKLIQKGRALLLTLCLLPSAALAVGSGFADLEGIGDRSSGKRRHARR